MLLVAGKKMVGWSEVEKERGIIPAAEMAPYAWAHRFLPQEAAKVSGGDDERGKVPLPWLNLVATARVEFKWIKFHPEITITEDGKRAVLSGPDGGWCAVAEPHVVQDSHWFEVQILDPGNDRDILIGWSALTVELKNIFDREDEGCAL